MFDIDILRFCCFYSDAIVTECGFFDGDVGAADEKYSSLIVVVILESGVCDGYVV